MTTVLHILQYFLDQIGLSGLGGGARRILVYDWSLRFTAGGSFLIRREMHFGQIIKQTGE